MSASSFFVLLLNKPNSLNSSLAMCVLLFLLPSLYLLIQTHIKSSPRFNVCSELHTLSLFPTELATPCDDLLRWENSGLIKWKLNILLNGISESDSAAIDFAWWHTVKKNRRRRFQTSFFALNIEELALSVFPTWLLMSSKEDSVHLRRRSERAERLNFKR